MASLDDILTTQRNGVIAINNLGQQLSLIEADLPCICTNLANIVTQLTILQNAGLPDVTSSTVAASTTYLEIAGSGRLVAVSIPTHSGSAQVYIYDSATTGGIAATNLIYASLPSNAGSFTPYQSVNLAFNNGLVLKTDAGITFCVAYTAN